MSSEKATFVCHALDAGYNPDSFSRINSSAPEGRTVEAGVESGESPAERYRRQLRDLLVAALDFRRVPASPPPTQNPGLRSDVLLAAEYVSEVYLSAPAPAGSEARAVWAEVADDILACLEQGRWDRLRPTERAVRVSFAWWFEMGWLGRAWCRLRGKEPRPGGRPLNEIVRAEPGAAPDRRGM
jgi:hypothetical protein